MLCQRQRTVLSSTVSPRSLEELEGSLLDPRNTHTDNNNNTNNMASNNLPLTANAIAVSIDDGDNELIQAIPVSASTSRPAGTSASPADYFEYSKENMEQDELLTASITASATMGANAADLPLAPTLNGYEDNSPEAQAVATSAKTRLGSDIGRVSAIEEKEKIRAISRMAKGRTYHEKARIQAATTVAKQRVREGFDNKETADKYMNSTKMQKEVEKQDAAFVKKGGKDVSGGYEVSEYNTEEYSCASYNAGEYEYKSVYD